MSLKWSLVPLLCTSACLVPVESEEAHVAVTSIEVDSFEGNLSPNLEVEVHLYDFATDVLLACANLSGVDDGSVRYEVDAEPFELAAVTRPHPLRVIDVAEREVYLWVIDRDRGSCPDDFNLAKDDIIGRSSPFPAAELGVMREMSFEGVLHLEIGTVLP